MSKELTVIEYLIEYYPLIYKKFSKWLNENNGKTFYCFDINTNTLRDFLVSKGYYVRSVDTEINAALKLYNKDLNFS